MNAIGKWATRGVWLTFAAVMTIGCNPLQTVAFLLHKDQPLPAEYPLRTKEATKEEREKEITVLLLTAQTGGVAPEFADTYRELASLIAKRLPEEARENKEKVTIVAQSQLDKFKMTNPTWKTMRPTVIGKKLGADYVIDLTIGSMNVYQPNSGNMIYEGRAEVAVQVYDVAAGSAEPMHKYVHQYIYPKTGMIAVGDVPLSRFKMDFVGRLAVEIARKHIDHKPGDGIGSER